MHLKVVAETNRLNPLSSAVGLGIIIIISLSQLRIESKLFLAPPGISHNKLSANFTNPCSVVLYAVSKDGQNGSNKLCSATVLHTK